MRKTDFPFNASLGIILFCLGIPLILGIFLMAVPKGKSHIARK